jgi:hypothetical protein
MDVKHKIENFNIQLTRTTHLVIVALHANGASSYRDASAFTRICAKKFGMVHMTIITDCMKKLDNYDPACTIHEVDTKKGLLNTISKQSSMILPCSDMLFVLSAHGYSKRYVPRVHQELNGRSEYIRIRGECVLDIELFSSLYDHMHIGVKSWCIVDTCHSGTMLDEEYITMDGGKSIKRSRTPLRKRPQSICISACGDSELAGEDVSDYGGWGGKLVCQVLDALYSHRGDVIHPYHVFTSIYSTFANQKTQRSHPVLGYNDCV